MLQTSHSIINLLKSSVNFRSLRLTKSIHCAVLATGLIKDLAVSTALLTVYSKLGYLGDARLVFDKIPEKDSYAWNALISAYYQNGHPLKSMELIRNMVGDGIRADLYTAIPAISSNRMLKCREWGKEIHAYVMRNGCDYQVSVHNALIDMYCECGCLDYARKIFDFLDSKSVISWSSMIKGYVNNDQSFNALSLFRELRLNGVEVDFIMVINLLPACMSIGALELVSYLHGLSAKMGLNVLASVNTALLVGYAKCGYLEMARKLFNEEKVINKDIITWNSMISAYAKHGEWFQCFNLYKQMKLSNLRPDELTFLGLLTACVNSGLVKEGRELFTEMMSTYRLKPSQEHYACMVDLLGRAGHVSEAEEVIKSMPFKPEARVLGPLLSACKMHPETKFAESAAEKLITLEPRNAGNYILLSNIYAAAGKWDGVAKMRSFLRDKGLKKTPGCSWLQINGHVHEFRVADKSHPRADDIYMTLTNLELETAELRLNFDKPFLSTDFIHCS